SFRKAFNIIVIALFLSLSFFNTSVYAQSNSDTLLNEQGQSEWSITTNLEDDLTTKADRLTFDLWAFDENDEKIEVDNIEVTNKEKSVEVKWDVEKKTSYTLDLEVGNNNVNIVVNYNDEKDTLQYKIVREEAEDGDVIGTYTFTLEGFTIGLGYFVEPV